MRGFRTSAALVLTLSLVAALVAGCTAEGKPVPLTGPGEAAGTVQALSGGDQATPVNMERSPDEEVAEEEIPGADEVVTSEGERVVPSGEAGVGVPGKAGSGAAPGEGSQVREKREVQWLVYRNEEFGFQVRYPSVYVLLPPSQTTMEGSEEPRPVAEFLFQDQDLARGDTAAMEPPQFAIRIFANDAGLSVDQWLRQNEVLGTEEFQVEAYSLGGVEGVRLTSRLLMAPGQHIYVAKGRYVFQLTPLGEYSNQMLASFAFLD